MTVIDIRKQIAEKLGAGSSLSCINCGTPTAYDTLSTLGAKCFPCYQAYCREPFHQLQRSHYAERVRAEIAAMGKKVPA